MEISFYNEESKELAKEMHSEIYFILFHVNKEIFVILLNRRCPHAINARVYHDQEFDGKSELIGGGWVNISQRKAEYGSYTLRNESPWYRDRPEDDEVSKTRLEELRNFLFKSH